VERFSPGIELESIDVSSELNAVKMMSLGEFGSYGVETAEQVIV
jgi:hypothetical protein